MHHTWCSWGWEHWSGPAVSTLCGPELLTALTFLSHSENALSGQQPFAACLEGVRHHGSQGQGLWITEDLLQFQRHVRSDRQCHAMCQRLQTSPEKRGTHPTKTLARVSMCKPRGRACRYPGTSPCHFNICKGLGLSHKKSMEGTQNPIRRNHLWR